MAKIESYTPGSFCWAELATNDVLGAKKFYTEMFGWTANEQPIPGGVYVMLESEGNSVGALYGARDGCLRIGTSTIPSPARMKRPRRLPRWAAGLSPRLSM